MALSIIILNCWNLNISKRVFSVLITLIKIYFCIHDILLAILFIFIFFILNDGIL